MNTRPSKTAQQECIGTDRCTATEHLLGCYRAAYPVRTYPRGKTISYGPALGGEPIKILSATATARGIEAQFQITDPAVLDRIRSGDVGGVSVSGLDLYEAIANHREATPKPTVYIAGPMSGHQDFNYHAFHYAAADLRAAGYTVLNPAENPKPNPDPSWQDWMRVALGQLIQADAIALLPGWWDSKGARLEAQLGKELGLDVRHVLEWFPGDGAHRRGSLYAPSVSSKTPPPAEDFAGPGYEAHPGHDHEDCCK